jgi:retron-type reverse transcriptase
MNITLAGRKIKMSKYRTATEYKEIVRTMPFKEVEGLFETYMNCPSRGVKDDLIMNILENEIERRISNWEVAYV